MSYSSFGKSNCPDHTSPLFKSLKVLKFHDVYKLESLKFINDLLYGHITIQFTSAFQAHTANTRHRHNLRPAFPQLEIQKKFLLYSGCMQYNEWPDDIKNIGNSDTFKIITKKYLIITIELYDTLNLSSPLLNLAWDQTISNDLYWYVDRYC